MTDRFFTNALSLGSTLVGTEQFPYDLVAGGSAFATPAQIATYVKTQLEGITDQYTAATNTAGFTATGAQVAGAPVLCVLDLTGTLAGAANLQMPTAAALVGAISGAFIGQTYLLRVLNNSSANFVWTVTTNTGITLNGTMTLNQSTFRDFLVTLTSLTAVSLQNVGSGGN